MKKYILKDIIVLSLLLLPLIIIGLSCDTVQLPASALTTWEVEYDYMTGYELFDLGDGQTYVRNAFNGAATNFVGVVSTTNIPAFIIPDYNSLFDFRNDNAECQLKSDTITCDSQKVGVYINNSPIPTEFEIVTGKYKSYLAGIEDFQGKSGPLVLGITLASGQDSIAQTYIFGRPIDSIFSISNNGTNGTPKPMIRGTVVHELGHLRADLTHYCVQNIATLLYSVRTSHHEVGVQCTMSTLPTSNCVTGNFTSHDPFFCDSCLVNLKAKN